MRWVGDCRPEREAILYDFQRFSRRGRRRLGIATSPGSCRSYWGELRLRRETTSNGLPLGFDLQGDRIEKDSFGGCVNFSINRPCGPRGTTRPKLRWSSIGTPR